MTKDETSVPLPIWVRDRYPANKRAAVDFLRAHIDETMLREIAEADYEQEVAKHFNALKPVWSGDDWEELGHWFPMEVLELIRWSEPEDPQHKPGASGLRGHRMRAFCCAVLLATSNFEPTKETLIQMLESVFAMGDEATDAMGCFLMWRLDSLKKEEDRPFFVLAMVAIVFHRTPELPLTREEELAEWLYREEIAERDYLSDFNPEYRNAPWLLGLSFNDMLNTKWLALIQKIQLASGSRPLGALLEYT